MIHIRISGREPFKGSMAKSIISRAIEECAKEACIKVKITTPDPRPKRPSGRRP